MPDPTATTSVRRRIADARATIVGTKGLRPRVAEHTKAISTLKARLDDQQRRVGRQDEQHRDLEGKVRDIEGKLRDLGRALTLATAERERRDAQFGALEVRLADLEQGIADARPGAVPPDDEQMREGRGLLQDVRTEHARIRTRMQLVSAYEERLRRVEESVTQLYEGDRRHQV